MSPIRLAPLVPFEEAVSEIPDSDFVEIEAQRVFAHDVGSGPALVLLHGFASTSYSFRELFEAMRGEHRLIGIDLNGFGNTERPRTAEAYRIEEQADLISKVLEKKGVESVVVAGHSYGAGVAAVLAERAPDLVSKVILICPPSQFAKKPPWYLRNAMGMRTAYLMIRALLSNPAKFKKLSGKAVFVEGVLTDELADIYRRSMLIEGFKEACYGYGKAFAQGTAKSIRYENIRHPALVIAGEKDLVVSSDSCRAVASRIPDSRFVEVPHCGHCPPEERPAEVIQSMGAFLREGGN